jgi:hypothetical protein
LCRNDEQQLIQDWNLLLIKFVLLDDDLVKNYC